MPYFTVESLEPKLAPSAVITTFTFRAVQAEIRSALGTLAKTGDRAEALRDLGEASSRVPYGARLLPAWRAQLAAIGPGTGLATQRQMLLALNSHLHRGLKAGAVAVRGAAAGELARLALDSIAQGLLVRNRAIETLTVSLLKDGEVFSRATLRPNGSIYFEPPSQGLPSPSRFEVEIEESGQPDKRIRIPFEAGETLTALDRSGQLVVIAEPDGFPPGRG